LPFCGNIIFWFEREHISAVRDKMVGKFVVFLPFEKKLKFIGYEEK